MSGERRARRSRAGFTFGPIWTEKGTEGHGNDAFIHSPPPPANQIVHVVPTKPARGLRSMEVVWVSGKLQAKRQDSYMGKSGYHMDAFKIEPYVAPPQ